MNVYLESQTNFTKLIIHEAVSKIKVALKMNWAFAVPEGKQSNVVVVWYCVSADLNQWQNNDKSLAATPYSHG